uniref:Uncharacterized protein n=1 Tax=Caenorhabditis japonica TaxID=281687 RepID=A0A8R1I344_CAEJA
MQRPEEGPSRTINVVDSTRTSRYPVLETMELAATNEIYASAPHTVHIMGTAYIAVNRYCIVKGQKTSTQPARDVMEHLIDDLPDHKDFDRTLDILSEFMKGLNLQNVFSFKILSPFDYSEQFSIIPVMLAMSKFFECFESTMSDDLVRDAMNNAMDKFELEISGRKEIIEATIQGSNFAQVLKGDQRRATTESMESVDDQYDFIFARTNLHVSDFNTRDFPAENINEAFRRALREEDTDSPLSLPAAMRTYSQARLDRKNYEMLQVEADCQIGLEKISGTDEKVLEGYEVQQGGVFVVLKKGEFANGAILETIARNIGLASERPITRISFELLRFGNAAASLSVAKARSFSAVDCVTIQLESGSQTTSEEEDEDVGESDSEMNADETFDHGDAE